MNSEIENKIFGGILGLALGDALGVPVEFKPRSYLDIHPVTEFLEFGTHNQPRGTWSDDTSLTLCLMDSLCKGLNYSDIGQKFIAWYNHSLWTANGNVFDIGISTREAIRRLENGTDPLHAGNSDEKSNGNGSLMRILPLAYFTYTEDSDSRRDKTFSVSHLTHGHIRSLIACWLYVEIICNLLNFLSKELAISKAYKTVEVWAIQNNLSYEWSLFKRCNESIVNVSRNNIKSSGYVLDSLEASLWCFLQGNNFEESVFLAVNLGDDTDTIAAITGGLSGTYYGFDKLRNDWLDLLQKKEDIFALTKQFISACKRYQF